MALRNHESQTTAFGSRGPLDPTLSYGRNSASAQIRAGLLGLTTGSPGTQITECYAISFISGTASTLTPSNAFGAPNNAFTSGSLVSRNGIWRMAEPPGAIGDRLQTIRVICRAVTSDAVLADTVGVYINGVSSGNAILQGTNTIVVNTTRTMTYTFPASFVTNKALVEFELVGASGGNLQVDAIIWDANHDIVNTFAGILKRWDGGAWVRADMKQYNGASFVQATLKRYDGATWVEVDALG